MGRLEQIINFLISFDFGAFISGHLSSYAHKHKWVNSWNAKHNWIYKLIKKAGQIRWDKDNLICSMMHSFMLFCSQLITACTTISATRTHPANQYITLHNKMILWERFTFFFFVSSWKLTIYEMMVCSSFAPFISVILSSTKSECFLRQLFLL